KRKVSPPQNPPAATGTAPTRAAGAASGATVPLLPAGTGEPPDAEPPPALDARCARPPDGTIRAPHMGAPEGTRPRKETAEGTTSETDAENRRSQTRSKMTTPRSVTSSSSRRGRGA